MSNYPLTPHSPHKIYLLVTCVCGGVLSLIRPDAVANSLTGPLPPWVGYLWAGSLLLSAAIALFGSWQAGVHGANIERLGLSLSTAACLAWGIAVITVNPEHGWGAGMFYIGFAVANVARIHLINKGLRIILEEVHRNAG